MPIDGSKNILGIFNQINIKGGSVDYSKWDFSTSNFQISATKVIGNTIYENLQGVRGERKQSETKMTVDLDHKKDE